MLQDAPHCLCRLLGWRLVRAGTANGGSALLWASMLHLNSIDNGRVITLDLNAPSWEVNATSW